MRFDFNIVLIDLTYADIFHVKCFILVSYCQQISYCLYSFMISVLFMVRNLFWKYLMQIPKEFEKLFKYQGQKRADMFIKSQESLRSWVYCLIVKNLNNKEIK